MQLVFNRSATISGISLSVLLAMWALPASARPAGTDALLEAARQGADQERYAAIDDLGEHHHDASKVVPQLTKLLDDDDPKIRWRSARALGDFGVLAKSAAPKLQSLLTHDDPIVQVHAAAALGRVGDSSDATIDSLLALVTDEDGRVARTALAALKHIKPGPKRIVEALGKALESDDQAVILHAVEAIVEGGAETVPFLNEALSNPKTAYLACVAIHEIGPDAAATVPALAKLLEQTQHSQLEIEALLALASIGPAAKSAAPQIIPLLKHPIDVTVPAAAAFALGASGASEAEDALRAALAQEDNAFLQMIAAWSLAKLHPDDDAEVREAVDRLVQGLGSEDAAVRSAAADCLQRLQAPPELVGPELIKMASDPDPAVAENVVIALASLGPSVLPKAIESLGKPEFRGLAVQVLTRLGTQAAEAAQPLADVLADADPEGKTDIHFALAAIGPGAAVATDALIESLSNDNERVRHTALLALRRIGPGSRAALDALLQQVESENAGDRLATAWALARIAPDDARATAQSLPILEWALANEEEYVRLETADALAAWGPSANSAIPALKRLAENDDSPAVRAAAQEALEQIRSQP